MLGAEEGTLELLEGNKRTFGRDGKIVSEEGRTLNKEGKLSVKRKELLMQRKGFLLGGDRWAWLGWKYSC